MTLRYVALKLLKDRQKLVILNAGCVVGLASGGIGHSTLTLIRSGYELYCIVDWKLPKVGLELMPGGDADIRLNADLYAEYQLVASGFQCCISEYMMECHADNTLPTSVVYIGSGWSAALALLMATIVPPDNLVLHDMRSSIGNPSAYKYLDSKMDTKTTVHYIYS